MRIITLDNPVMVSPTSSPDLDGVPDRHVEVLEKQAVVAKLLRAHQVEGMLLFQEENLNWFMSGSAIRGVLDPEEMPALFIKEEQRWLISSNVDTQRVFDEEIFGLGFQIKEWPWHWGREQLLADLTANRQICCDRPRENAKDVANEIAAKRRNLSLYEQACMKSLGGIVSHAIEATCRTMPLGQTEREIAGQVCHRLLHRGAFPVHVEVAVDGRSKLYKRGGASATPMKKYGVVRATARKYGLHATASRTVCFGDQPAELKQDHDAASKVAATYLASTWPDGITREILGAAKRVYELVNYEHDWRLMPQGFITGRLPIEKTLGVADPELFQSGWAITWQSAAGVAQSSDTFLVTDQGPVLLTPTELWPIKKIRLQGAEFFRPDVLIRS